MTSCILDIFPTLFERLLPSCKTHFSATTVAVPPKPRCNLRQRDAEETAAFDPAEMTGCQNKCKVSDQIHPDPRNLGLTHPSSEYTCISLGLCCKCSKCDMAMGVMWCSAVYLSIWRGVHCGDLGVPLFWRSNPQNNHTWFQRIWLCHHVR